MLIQLLLYNLMKLTSCIITVLITLQSYSQQRFYDIVKNVGAIGYHLTDSLYKAKEHNLSYTIDAKQNWVNKGIDEINKLEHDSITLYRLKTSEIKTIEVFYIKSDKKVMGNTFGRAEIQQWTFISAAETEQAVQLIKTNYETLNVRLYKGAWSYWAKGNKLYFILTPGTYMEGHVKMIETNLKNSQS